MERSAKYLDRECEVFYQCLLGGGFIGKALRTGVKGSRDLQCRQTRGRIDGHQRSRRTNRVSEYLLKLSSVIRNDGTGQKRTGLDKIKSLSA